MTSTKPYLALRSWRVFLPVAVLPPLAYLLMGMLGGKECLHFVTGIEPVSFYEGVVGILYLVSYLMSWVVSPILVIAAGLIAVRDWFGCRVRE